MRLAIALLFICSWTEAQPARVASTFDVASVKPSDPDEQGGRVEFLSGGRFAVENCKLNFIIQQVYGLKDFQIVDAPKWISDWNYRFDINAKGNPSASNEQLRLMAQGLLAERFQLRVHRDTREIPSYSLVATKNGLKLHLGKDDGGRIRPGGIGSAEAGVLEGRKVSMEALIRALTSEVDRPILDRTNYTEPFDFRLEWRLNSADPSDDRRPSLFVALQQQLGLKLEPVKAPVEVLAIDHVEKPSAN